jgi:hypothetical protein
MSFFPFTLDRSSGDGLPTHPRRPLGGALCLRRAGDIDIPRGRDNETLRGPGGSIADRAHDACVPITLRVRLAAAAVVIPESEPETRCALQVFGRDDA